ncbi:MAG: type VI secretion system-associated FHA domain protein TagH [Pseudomonadota bacterium]
MIKIAVVSYNNEVPAEPLFALFGQEGNTLGRGEDNFFVLPDPQNVVSRSQASIWSDGTRHTLVNLSQANPILVNGQEIVPERDYEIQVGDEIQVGLYLMRVESPSTAMYVAPEIERTILLRPAAAAAVVAAAAAAPPKSEAVEVPAAAVAAEVAEVPVEANALLQAFLHGAGIPSVSITSGLTPELMELLGKLIASSVKGTIELIASRALFKREANAEVTMVVMRNNNPLKFFPDSETVLIQMLRKKMPGFMGPVEALEDAFADLQAHQRGVVAGNRAAKDAMLRRLDPRRVEKKLDAPSFMDGMMPAKRKALMWDLYAEQFDAVSVESKDDFQALFGKDFLKAYETEVDRFKVGGTGA